MVDHSSAPAALLGKGSASGLLREMIGCVAQQVVPLYVEVLVGAGHGAREGRVEIRRVRRNTFLEPSHKTIPLNLRSRSERLLQRGALAIVPVTEDIESQTRRRM
jgi:hypothetical protein